MTARKARKEKEEASSNPHIEEEEKDEGEESNPHLPADTRAFRHAQHAVHISPDPGPCILEGVVKVCDMCRVANFVSDSHCDLIRHIINMKP